MPSELIVDRDQLSEVSTTPIAAEPGSSRPVARTSGSDGHEARPTPLTPREREVVALAREGASTRDIGRRLGIPTRAVAALLGDARRKLAANDAP